MPIRRKKSDDYIGPSTGITKWVNKIFRFVLFPFIHPLFFVILLAVLGGIVVGIHHFASVKYKDIPVWVVDQSKVVLSDVSKKINKSYVEGYSSKADDVIKKVKETVSDEISMNKKSIDETMKAINRKAFVREQDIPVDIKVVIQKDNTPDSEAEVLTLNEQSVNIPKIDNEALFAIKYDDSKGFIYTAKPRIIMGEIFVVNANEIKINNEEMFLYGIYVEPLSNKGTEGATYLQNLVRGKKAECRVVAFTQNADPTVVCVVDNVNINHKMVDMGYSKNISLR